LISRALKYAENRFPVFPCCFPIDGKCGCGRGHTGRDIGKVPLTPNGLKDATIEKKRIIEYWTKYPKANIAIAISPGYFILDVDIEHNGYDSLGKLQDVVGELPKTLQITTGSGGAHFWYITREPIRNITKLGGYEGLDIRGVGGFVISPPSNHVSGLPYAKSPIWSGPIMPASRELEELCMKPVKALTSNHTGDTSILTEGSRNDTLARIAGAMRRQGTPEEAIYSALLITNRDRCQPVLSDNEVLTISKSISRYPPEQSALTKRRKYL